MLGNGRKGDFIRTADHAAGDLPFGVAAGDFTGDKRVDLAVVDSASDSVSLLEGDGAGSFGPPMLLPVGDGPVSVATADLNGDGRLDLAVANENSPTVSILFGKTGGFKPARTELVGSDPKSVAIGQLDGKSGLDIAVLDYATGVHVLRGNGAGDFKAPKLIAVPALDRAYGFALGQLDNKGRIDIWISRCVGEGPTANALLISKGKTGLGYKPPEDREGGDCAYEPEITDVDGNGYKDVLVTSETTGT